MKEALLQVEDLKVHFPVHAGLFRRTKQFVYAVDGVSFYLNKGETLGVVGESGCGKSTTGLAVLSLMRPTSGRITFEGRDISDISGMPLKDRLHVRKALQIIFQEPYSSLNPRMTLRRIINDTMHLHGLYTGSEREDRIEVILNRVGLTPEQGHRYPHEFSGGQRQRIGIARALCLDPQIIIGDEPVSALDVSIQAQIINLLVDLQETFNLSYIIIAHDLAVVEHISDRIAVMYLGKIIETTPSAEIYRNPRHPYTRALLSAVPVADPRATRNRILLEGDVPSPRRPPKGCGFHPRCPDHRAECNGETPPLRHIQNHHYVACHRV